MNGLLEEIVREANPIHDFDRIRFLNECADNFESIKAKFINGLYFAAGIPRALVRGGIVGGAVGYGAASIFGNPSTAVAYGVYGVMMGGMVDYTQYFFRAMYFHHREQRFRD